MRLSYESDDAFGLQVKNYNNEMLVSKQEDPTLRFLACNFIKTEKLQKNKLKQVVTATKVKILTQNFIRKLRKNNVYRKPIDQSSLNEKQQEEDSRQKMWFSKVLKFLLNTQGFKMNSYFLTIWALINIIQLTTITFIFTVNTVFTDSKNQQVFMELQYFSLILYFLDMVLNCITQKNQFKYRAVFLSEILRNYLSNGLIIDLLSILIFPIDWQLKISLAPLKSIFSIIKLSYNIRKIEKFQYLFLLTKQRQQYYSLFKVFVTNFIIGHFLSLILNFMTQFNQMHNWYHKLGISAQNWFIRYVWGYYWGTNIMLTVGFGDITATNHIEALILIFIQTLSCITLAYNISNVGTLISQIKANNDQKKRKLRTFHAMCQDSDIPQELQQKVTHFIEQSFQIKESFQYDEYDNVLNSLPKSVQSQYLKQANKTLFGSLGFLSNLSKKSFLNLAQTVNRKIAHPSQIIYKKGQTAEFNILASGKLSYNCRIFHSDINGLKVEQIVVQKTEKPKLLSLDFVKRKILNYDIKSMGYSILYYLKQQQFIDILRNSDMDFQMFCSLRDKDQHTEGAYQLYPCAICKNSFHNKFTCDRLHYVPIKQVVFFKELNRSKKERDIRVSVRRKKIKTKAFIKKKLNESDRCKYLITHFGQKYLKECQNIRNFAKILQQEKKSRLCKKVNYTKDSLNNNQEDQYVSPFRRESYLANRETQLIKIQKMIMKSQHQYSDVFWEINLDVSHNFRYYMLEWNTERLPNNEGLHFGMKLNR